MKNVPLCQLMFLMLTMAAFGQPPATAAANAPMPAADQPPAASTTTAGAPTIEGTGAFNGTGVFSGKATSGAGAATRPTSSGTMTVTGTVTIVPATPPPQPATQFGVYACLNGKNTGNTELIATGAFSIDKPPHSGVRISLSMSTVFRAKTPQPGEPYCLQGDWSLFSQSDYELQYSYVDQLGQSHSTMMPVESQASVFTEPILNKDKTCAEGSLKVVFKGFQPTEFQIGRPITFGLSVKCHGLNPDFCKGSGLANETFLMLSGTLTPTQPVQGTWSVQGNPGLYFPTVPSGGSTPPPDIPCPRPSCRPSP